jgi:aldehyde:ferredoxin oxidoreductase
MSSSYTGRLLEIDLTTRRAQTRETNADMLDLFLGGKGLGFEVLAERALRSDPYSPRTPLILAAGPLTGTKTPTSVRSVLITKSPLFGGALDSHVGGSLGPKIKAAGYDYIIIAGRSSEPIVLRITSSNVEFIPGTLLWGKGVFEVERQLRAAFPGSSVLSIGPAGENLVRYANVGNDLYRRCGRGGAGAVMGSKQLKAIVIDGDMKTEYYDPKRFAALNGELVRDVVALPSRQARHEQGTLMWIRLGQEVGRFLPTHNFRDCQFDPYENLTSENVARALNWQHTGCHGCIVRCAKQATWDGKELEGPEYESAAFLGPNCGVGEAKTVAEANWLCDDLGLDTISCGVTVSFAMECYEKGLLRDTGGLELLFGNGEALLALIPRIAQREGLGDMLAEGTRRAAETIGQDSARFAIHIGGLELSGVNPKGCLSAGLALATSDFASHTRLWTATDEMQGRLALDETLPSYIRRGQDVVNARNSLIVCDFLELGLDRLLPLLHAATGMEKTESDALEVGERISNLARMFNCTNGRSAQDDTLPDRFFEEPMTAGLLEGKTLTRQQFNTLIRQYYQARGWGADGMPTNWKLEQLGLERL